MPDIALAFKVNVWEKLPRKVQSLGEESRLFRFHDQMFQTLFADKALPEINALKDQIFLDTATGDYLDLKGEEFGVQRKVSEDDDSYRERMTYRMY